MERKRNMISKYPFSPIDTSRAGCIDGRKSIEPGADLRPKIPGASISFAVAEWIIAPKDPNPTLSFKSTLRDLKDSGIKLGVHSDDHHASSEIDSGCGFADKLPVILNVLSESNSEIWQKLSSSFMRLDKNDWDFVMVALKERLDDTSKLPKGKELLNLAKEEGADEIVLTGHHNETAAIVNDKEGTTLDPRRANEKGVASFNYDRWYFLDGFRKLGWKEEEIKKADVLGLGLFAATEIVLVEKNNKEAIPIVLNTQS